MRYTLLLGFLCGVLCAAVIILLIRLRLLQKSLSDIGESFRDRLEDDTNTLITVLSNDRYAMKLADDINRELRQLRRLRLRYQNGDRELKDAVANISHDLRTPLTAISGYLELLEREEQSDNVRRYVGYIKNRAELMTRMTEELFRYFMLASVENGTTENACINRVLEECIVSHCAALEDRGITPVITIADEPIMREVSVSDLTRIFDNILSNAMKYSDGDLTICLTKEGAATFTNSAAALDRVTVGRLFDRFYTVETGRNSTGLGLSIAKLLTERMGGTISADYTNGRLRITVEFQ